MPITIKPIGKIVEKYKNRTAQAAGDYKEGIDFAPDQGAAAAAAKDTWRDAVTSAGVSDRFAANAQKSTAKWKKNATTVGPRRYTEGTANATGEFQAGVSEALQVIQNTNLPPRFPKGDPRNLDRVRVINENLRKLKSGG